jgi:hypothetical protein
LEATNLRWPITILLFSSAPEVHGAASDKSG